MGKLRADKAFTQKRWPCVFYGHMSDKVDARVQAEWQAKIGKGAPFGSLRKEWRSAHCRTLNPYGSEDCPYPVTSCAEAFYQAVHGSLEAAYDPRVYFISAARSSALERADNKPLARDRDQASEKRVMATWAVGRGRPPGCRGVVEAGRGEPVVPGVDESSASTHLRRTVSRPIRLGDLLRPPDGGSREGRGGSGEDHRP